MTTEKLNIKVFLGDNPTPEDFSFSQLSTKSGSILPTTTNDILFSSIQSIPFQNVKTETERIQLLTNPTVFTQYIKSSPRVSNDDIRTNINNNIMTVLFFLFPAFYNSTPNIHNSYDDRITHNEIPKINAPVLKNNKVSTPADGIVYYKGNTVVQLTWKNDIFNVPEFQQLFNDIYNFYVWSKTTGIPIINEELQRIVKDLINKDSFGNNIREKLKSLQKMKTSPTSKTNVSQDNINDITSLFEDLIKNYNELKKKYDNREEEIQKEKIEKIPVEKKETNRKKFEKEKDPPLNNMIFTIKKIINYKNVYFQNDPHHPASNIIKETIDYNESLIENRSIYNVFDKNEYIFKSYVSLLPNQQNLFEKLSKGEEYMKMANSINKFRSSVIKTSNLELDTLCNDFFKNKNQNLLYFILYYQKNLLLSTKENPILENTFEEIAEKIAEQGSNSSSLYYVGPIRQNNNNLLIYIGLDLIRGKINSLNEKEVKKCLFSNERLGNLFTDLRDTKRKITVTNYIYDVFNDGSIVENKKPQQGGVRLGKKTRKLAKRNKRKKRKSPFSIPKKTTHTQNVWIGTVAINKLNRKTKKHIHHDNVL